tara:strand:- start:53 stop:616 length:564 start_codon:yes stop_codon:yes gene_type:complete
MAQIIVLEDFYSDPYYVREQALKMEWHDKKGNHPGKRTDADRHPTVKTLLEKEIGAKITNWDAEWNTHNGCYNLCKSWDKCWIHSDWGTTWACVVYLTPDAPLESGTALYKHKETGLRIKPEDEDLYKKIEKDSLDFTAWEVTDYVGNIFNRAIVYRGEYYHAAVQYFGNTDEYCRMHQTFFFSTED